MFHSGQIFSNTCNSVPIPSFIVFYIDLVIMKNGSARIYIKDTPERCTKSCLINLLIKGDRDCTKDALHLMIHLLSDI